MLIMFQYHSLWFELLTAILSVTGRPSPKMFSGLRAQDRLSASQHVTSLKSTRIHPYQIPAFEKIVLSVGVDQTSFTNKKILACMLALKLVGQQKCKLTRSKTHVAPSQPD